METPRVSDAFASAVARSAGQGPRSGAERLPLMRASTAAFAQRKKNARPVRGPCAPHCRVQHPTNTLRARCNTVRYHASSFAIVRHARSSCINLDHPDSRAEQLLEIDLHAETTNPLDARAYRGILHHACG